jgi:hypothetical protein
MEVESLLYGSSVKGTLKDGSFSGNSKSYMRHVKEGFEMEHPSLYDLCEPNLEGRLLYRGLQETCNGKVWKQNLRYLAREGLANMFIGLQTVHDIFLCHI